MRAFLTVRLFCLTFLAILAIAMVDASSPASSAPVIDFRVEADGTATRAVSKNCNLLNAQTEVFPMTDFGEAGMRGAITPDRLIYSAGRYVLNYSRTTCALVKKTKYEEIFSFGLAGNILIESDLIYDPLANRCIIYASFKDSPFAGFSEYVGIAISRDSNCTRWNAQMIQARGAGNYVFECLSRGQTFSKITLGSNINRIAITADVGDTGSLLSLDKNALMAGRDASYKCFRNIASPVIVPSITADTENTMMLIAADGASTDRIRVRRWHLVTSNRTPDSDSLSIMPDFVVGAWQAPPSALQPNQQPLNTGKGRFQTASRQLGPYLWNAHVVKAGAYARSRIYKFAVNLTRPLLSYQPTTSACQGRDNLFAPSLDIQSSAADARLFVTVLRTCPGNAATGKLTQLALRGPNQSAAGWTAAVIGASQRQVQLGVTGASRCTEENNGCDIGLATATQRDPSNPARAWTFGKMVTGNTVYHWRGKAAEVSP